MTRACVCILVVWSAFRSLAAAGVDPQVEQAQQRRVAAIARAQPSVVSVFARQGQNGGSGVVISADGYALSNYHVTSSTGDMMLCGMADGRLYNAVIVGIDPTGDVALIKLMGRDDFPAATLGNSDDVRVGDWVFAMGNPFLLATDFQPSVSFGMVSGVHRYQYPSGTLLEYSDCIQTDAAVNPGNSGGPLFDDRGRLVGINGRCSFEKRGRVNVGVAYAISINQIKNFLWDLKSGRLTDHATLGAVVKSDDQGRVVVSEILEESDAYRRGLRVGDEISAFAGRPIRTVNGLKNVLGIYPSGWSTALSFRRDGTTYDVTTRLAAVHPDGVLERLTRRRPPGHPRQEPDRQRRPGGLRPRLEQQQPARPEGEQVQLPAEVTSRYEPQPGYTNYYFNRLQQQRVWSASLTHGDYTSLTDTWQIDCRLAGGGDGQFRLGDKAALSRLPGGESALLAEDELTTTLDPPGSGGLLVALHLWRRWLTTGPEGCEELYYLGRRPIAGHSDPADVLVARYGGVNCHLYHEPTDGRLLELAIFPSDVVDPCQVRFGDHREVGGRLLPGEMEVVHGESLFGIFEIREFQFAAD